MVHPVVRISLSSRKFATTFKAATVDSFIRVSYWYTKGSTVVGSPSHSSAVSRRRWCEAFVLRSPGRDC